MFNPFGKKFSDVKEVDLEILKSVAEGWNIEYKRQKLSGQKIAKSISSFANSQGGIYFIGIEADNTTNYASNFVGVDDSPDVIRDACNGNLQPFPYLETFSINLQNGKKVLMTIVPEGRNPPYINSDGKIYRRQEAASDPIPETNRHTIDELYKKAQKYEEELEEFRDFDLTFCQGESNIPYLEIFVNSNPFNHFVIKDFFSKDNLQKVLRTFNGTFKIDEKISGQDTSFSGDIKFDSINTYNDSISLRFLEGSDLAYNGMTIMLDIFGNIKFLIPLNKKSYLQEKIAGEYLDIFNKSKQGSISSVMFLDARQIIGAIFGLINNYVKYLNDKQYNAKLEFKYRLRNCWRKTLYIESQKFIDHVKEFGIPICMKSEQYFPYFPQSFKIEELKESPITNCLLIFSHVANALGIPSEVAIGSVLEEIQNNPQQENPEN